MKKIIRIIALFLALLTISGMAVACSNPNEPEVTTEDNGVASTSAPAAETTEEATDFVHDDLPESMNFGETVTFFIWSDYTMREFHAEENGNLIDESIYSRNNRVANRLGIEIVFVEEKGASTKMNSWIQKKVRYQDDPQASEMIDILKENITFDIGNIYAESLGNTTANGFRTSALSVNPSGYLSNITKNKKIIEAGLAKTMEFYNSNT